MRLKSNEMNRNQVTWPLVKVATVKGASQLGTAENRVVMPKMMPAKFGAMSK